jgi:CBS domain-containing protein
VTSISESIETQVATVAPRQSVLEAASLMCERHIGSVVVAEGGRIDGLFTERDLMRRVVRERLDPARVAVRDVLRDDIPKVLANETAERCIELMKQHQTRHLLVYRDNAFVGIISMRDLLMLLLREKEVLVRQLTEYITS